ncbi:MAG TPA: nuclear transport factor 2 family protein [Novosphingobium sp.]|nr:nuclear transport factor 2 family protein [Novosphingobium sp.]
MTHFTEHDYLRYVAAFNARDYATLETFFADDFVLENAGFQVAGKPAFREFYRFFHAYCRESVAYKGFYSGENGFVAHVVITFEGIEDLTAEVLDRYGYPGMTPVAKDSRVSLEFLILYELNREGLIRHIKGAVWVPAGG